VFEVRGVRAPLVGRSELLSKMEAAVTSAIDFQMPQLISVVGNQGTGKSRLISELTDRVEGRARIFAAAASRDGGRYHVIARLLRDRFDISDGEPRAEVLDKFRAEVERVFEDNRVSEVLHFLGGFIDLHFPDSPFLRVLDESPTQHDEIAAAVLRRFIEVDAANGPVVLVLDDLQWAGDDTLALLRRLGRNLGGSPVVLVAAARTDLSVRLADWGEGVTEHLRVELRNLEDEDAEQMLRRLLHRCDHVPVEIVDDAVEMTGGNPAFIEQLVQLFIDNGTIQVVDGAWRIDVDKAAETELPISIEEAIEARIAALEVVERDVLEKGAAFGNVFWVGAVVSMRRIENREKSMDQDDEPDTAPSLADPLKLEWGERGEDIRREVVELIDELVERDYLLRLDPADSTIAGDVELVFKHNLERELIAKSTDRERLATYHRNAAKWFETKIVDRTEEQLEFLAQLYDKGGARRRAAYCYLGGGDKALGRYANAQAISLYTRGLDKLGEDDAYARLTALHNLGDVYDRVGRTDEALLAFREMLSVAWLFEAQGKGGAAHSRIGRIHRGRGEYDLAMRHLNRAQDLFTRASDNRGIAACLDDVGKVHYLRGAYNLALEHHRKALSIRRGIGDERSIALSLANIGRVHHVSGGFKAAIAQFREALDLRRNIGDDAGVIQSLVDLGGVHMADGQGEMALELHREAYELAQRTGDKLAQAETLARLGESKAVVGDAMHGIEDLLEAISLAGSLSNRVALSGCFRRLAEAWLIVGDLAQAQDYAQRALDIGRKVGSRVQVATSNRVLGEVGTAAASDSDGIAEAEEHFRRAIEILAGMKNELELARAYRSFAALRDRQGMADDAARLRQRADEIYSRLHGAAAV
ncbi:MAG: tetratricopeptide repeat protein, partial [Deltaproteobacteria bacterium]|nr:tetratricopeptide repeat protein [Deltaproteobacteria bacterium]